MTTPRDFRLDLLVRKKLLAEDRLAVMEGAAGGSADAVEILHRLAESGQLEREAAVQAWADEFDMPVADLETAAANPRLADEIPAALLEQYDFWPLAREGKRLAIALADPLDTEATDELSHRLHLEVEARLAWPPAIHELRRRWKNGLGQAVQDLATTADNSAGLGQVAATPPGAAGGTGEYDFEQIDTSAGEGPILRFVNHLIEEAMRRRASDIHLEPLERRFRIRYRVDGVLQEGERPPKRLQPAILSRVKLMAGLSIAEKRRPQDGRIQSRVEGKDLDLRVSSVPSVHGETIVMRLLDKEGLRLGLPELGFFDDDHQLFERLIASPEGMLLVTGPTGSGKSTTLYSALHYLNKPDRKIITVEDPVEYQMQGINQVQARAEVGMTFAAALRAMLRQAPNIIMVGEIRDLETAEIAVHAALTGHMVFSTLHTNDSPGAISRLIDLGLAPYLVAACLRGVVAQRLVRMVCTACRVPAQPPEQEWRALGLSPQEAQRAQWARGNGCARCHGSGYYGRKGIFEILTIDDRLRQLIHRHASLTELRNAARQAGWRSMGEDGARKAAAGLTTAEEVLANTLIEPANAS